MAAPRRRRASLCRRRASPCRRRRRAVAVPRAVPRRAVATAAVPRRRRRHGLEEKLHIRMPAPSNGKNATYF